MKVITLNRTPEKNTIIYPEKWFIINITFRLLERGCISLLDFSVSKCASSSPLGPLVSNKLAGKRERRKHLVSNQPLPYNVTIHLIKVPKSEITSKKCNFSCLLTRESQVCFSEYINQIMPIC